MDCNYFLKIGCRTSFILFIRKLQTKEFPPLSPPAKSTTGVPIKSISLILLFSLSKVGAWREDGLGSVLFGVFPFYHLFLTPFPVSRASGLPPWSGREHGPPLLHHTVGPLLLPVSAQASALGLRAARSCGSRGGLWHQSKRSSSRGDCSLASARAQSGALRSLAPAWPTSSREQAPQLFGSVARV